MLLNINNMTTEQKLSMLLCIRSFNENDMEFVMEMVKKRAVSCIQANPRKPEQWKKIVEAADYPILVMNDMEQGFPPSNLPQIPVISLAACGKKEYFESFAKGVVRDAKAEGFTGNWGPVIDLHRIAGPFNVGRNFSDDPKVATEYAAILMDIYKKNHFLATGKHFPGGQDCPFDTHMAEGFTNLSEKELMEVDIYPYIELHKMGLLPCIMTNHQVYTSLDTEYPASLSKKCIDIIRNLGFDGVCFTDSLAMMGILQKYGEKNAYGLAVYAGNDILLPNVSTSAKECYEMVCEAYKEGMFSEERLNEAVRRILAAMQFVSETPEHPTVFTEKDEENLNSIAKECITSVLDEGVSAKLGGKNEDKLFVIITNSEAGDIIEQEIHAKPGWYSPVLLGKTIQKEFPGAGIVYLPEYPAYTDNHKIFIETVKYKEVIFCTYCQSQCYLGSDAMTRRVEAVINALVHSGKTDTVVHFGNPFAVNNLLHIKRKIFGYNIKESQKYCIEALAGKFEPRGKLPFKVDFN